MLHVVAYLLEAGALEPESGSGTIFVSRQRVGKRVPAATDTHSTIELLLETVCSVRLVQGGCAEDSWGSRFSSVQEAVKKKDS